MQTIWFLFAELLRSLLKNFYIAAKQRRWIDWFSRSPVLKKTQRCVFKETISLLWVTRRCYRQQFFLLTTFYWRKSLCKNWFAKDALLLNCSSGRRSTNETLYYVIWTNWPGLLCTVIKNCSRCQMYCTADKHKGPYFPAFTWRTGQSHGLRPKKLRLVNKKLIINSWNVSSLFPYISLLKHLQSPILHFHSAEWK